MELTKNEERITQCSNCFRMDPPKCYILRIDNLVLTLCDKCLKDLALMIMGEKINEID